MFLATVASAATPLAHAENATLTVTLKNVRDASGAAGRPLPRASHLPQGEKAVEVARHPPRPGEVTLSFRELPPGRYAIMAYHDENGDGQLNRRFGMFPTEGYGLSTTSGFRPPAFEDSAFEVTAPETAIAIELRYWWNFSG